MPGLKFRVLLDSLKEHEIFRDIIVNDDDNFESLYTCILESFGFENNEMASFFVSDHEWNKGDEISLMDMSFGDAEETPETMSTCVIRHTIESPKQRFILVYDFLNMWIFLIELQEIMTEDVKQPTVVFAVGEITDEMKKEGNQSLNSLQFETDKLDNDNPFDVGAFDDDFDDDYLSDDFENIDDLDL